MAAYSHIIALHFVPQHYPQPQRHLGLVLGLEVESNDVA